MSQTCHKEHYPSCLTFLSPFFLFVSSFEILIKALMNALARDRNRGPGAFAGDKRNWEIPITTPASSISTPQPSLDVRSSVLVVISGRWMSGNMTRMRIRGRWHTEKILLWNNCIEKNICSRWKNIYKYNAKGKDERKNNNKIIADGKAIIKKFFSSFRLKLDSSIKYSSYHLRKNV